MKARRGYTLVELLVVMAIIAVLAGLAVPAVQTAIQSASRTNCISNMRNIGLAVQMYRDNNYDTFPDAAMLPSLTPDRPSLTEALKEYTEHDQRVFRCPSDQTYFRTEGISYEYPGPVIGGRTWSEVSARRRGRTHSSHRFSILWDYDSYHLNKTRNFLYADGHAETH